VGDFADSFTGEEAEDSAKKLVEQFRKENPGLEEYGSPSIPT
jgi:hypothetical protein